MRRRDVLDHLTLHPELAETVRLAQIEHNDGHAAIAVAPVRVDEGRGDEVITAGRTGNPPGARPDVRDVFIKMGLGAFQQGARGAAWDMIVLGRPWGFRLEDIAKPVHVWHGEADTMCPVGIGRYVAERIPDCHATFYPQDGHLSLFVNHYEGLLSVLVA